MINTHIFSSYLTPLFTAIKKLKSSQLNWMYEQFVTHTGNGVIHIWVLCVSLKTPPRRKYYLDKIELIYEGWNFSGTTFSISIKQSFH